LDRTITASEMAKRFMTFLSVELRSSKFNVQS
jgi:hypothetical protein